MSDPVDVVLRLGLACGLLVSFQLGWILQSRFRERLAWRTFARLIDGHAVLAGGTLSKAAVRSKDRGPRWPWSRTANASRACAPGPSPSSIP